MSRRAIISVGLWCLLRASSPEARADPYIPPDAELLVAEFTEIAGYSPSTSTVDGKIDVAGPGALFAVTLSGPDSGKLGIGDPWPTNPAAALGWDPVLHHWTSLDAFDSYRMRIQYVAGPPGSEIHVSLILNTGLTGPSGFPSGDPTNDTFWCGPWTAVSVGQSVTVMLDFENAEAWNIADNKAPHTGGGLGWPNGERYAINGRDRNEISGIGLQIADFDGDAMGSQLTMHLNVPEPATLALLAAGGLGAIGRAAGRRRNRPTADDPC